MKIIRSRAVGFFSDFLSTIRLISKFENENEPWCVYWGPESLYYDSEQGSNVWDYYFKSTKNPIGADYIADYPPLVLKEGKNFRESMNYYIEKYAKLNSTVQNIVDSNMKGFEKNKVLGLHIRRTDKFEYYLHYEPDVAKPVELEKVQEVVDKLIEKDNYSKIYLATDDNESYEFFKQKYDKMIIAIDAFRSSGKQSIHMNHKNISGYKKGLDALLDCIFLSKCSFLIKSSSNLSTTSQYYNLNLKHINVNELFCNDTREHEIGLYSEKYD